MPKWENPTKEEEKLIRERGFDPGRAVVNRIGVDGCVVMDLKTREEFYLRK